MEARIPVWTPQDSRSWNLAEGKGLEMRNGALSAGIPTHHSALRSNVALLTGLVNPTLAKNRPDGPQAAALK